METFAPRGNIHGPILPQFVLEKSMTFGAKTMYAILCDYAADKDHCWPSQTTLSKRLSCSISSVKNYLAELVREKLIFIRREQYRSSVYYLLCPEACSEQQETNTVHQQSEYGCDVATSSPLTTLNKQRKEENPPFPPMRPVKQRLFLFVAHAKRLRRGACLFFLILKASGRCTPKRKPRASPAWPGSNSHGAASFHRSRNSMPRSGASRLRKAGSANRAALCRKWATGCVVNAGSIRFLARSRRKPHKSNPRSMLATFVRNRNSAFRHRKTRKERDCGPCSMPLRRNSRP